MPTHFWDTNDNLWALVIWGARVPDARGDWSLDTLRPRWNPTGATYSGSSGWTSPVCEEWLTRDCDRLRQLTVEALDRLLA